MKLRELKVEKALNWGKLVKTWATGLNYVDHTPTKAKPVPTDPAPAKFSRPNNFEEFVIQCAPGKGDAGLKWSDGTPADAKEDIGFVMVQQTPNMVFIKLPPAEMIQQTEIALLAGTMYDLPEFYSTTFRGNDGQPSRLVAKDEPAKMDLHANRIGDYVLRICH